MRPKTWDMHSWGDLTIEGTGEDLTFVVQVYRKTKTGRRHDFVLRINACRQSVRQLAEQVAAMQRRDNARIEREQARIRNEVVAVQWPRV